jgi:hypothetical protein
MSIVAGVDFGTLSVRVSLFDKNRRRLGSGAAEYPLNRSIRDANLATQNHAAQMSALENAMRKALEARNVNGDEINVFQACPSGAESTAIDCAEGLQDHGLSLLDVFNHGFARSLGIALLHDLVETPMRLEFVRLKLLTSPPRDSSSSPARDIR